MIAAMICVLTATLPDRYIKSLVINVTHFLTQRQLHIGTLELERSLNPRLTLTDVAFSNASWAARDSLFSADSISASIQLSKLLTGQFVVEDISSSGIQTHLEVSSNGEKNWQLSSEPMSLPPLSRLTIVKTHVRDTLLTFLDRKTTREQRLMLDEVLLNNRNTDSRPQVLVNGSINSLPVSATLALQTTKPGPISITDTLLLPYELDMTAGEVKVVANGQLNKQGNTQQIDSDIAISLMSLTQLGDVINRPLPDIGPLDLSATVTINPETIAATGLQIPDLRLTIADPILQLEAQGQLSDVPAINSAAVNLSLNAPDTDQLLALFNIKRRIPGELALNAMLTGSDSVYNADLKSAQLSSEFITAVLSGSVTDILNSARADVSVSLDTPDLSLVTQLFGTNMPPEWGPITATTKLQGENGKYALNNIDATLNGNSTARAAGSIKSLVPFDDMHLDVDVSLSTLAEVSAFTRKPLPDIGPMKGTGVVGWRDGKLFLQDAKARHNSQYGIAVVTGNIGDLIRFDKVRLRADAELPNFAALDLFTGFTLPDVDGVKASTNLISANALDLSARQLNVSTTIDGVTVVGRGSVESFIKPYINVDLDLTSEIETLTRLNTLTGRQLPGIGPLKATAQLAGVGGDISLNDITATLSDENLSGALTSKIDNLKYLDKLQFDVDLQANDVGLLATDLGFDSDIHSPASLTTTVRIEGKNLQFENTDIDVDGNNALANISMLNLFSDEQSTQWRGDIALVNVDIKKLLNDNEAQQPGSDTDAGSKMRQTQEKARLLSTQTLPIKFMRKDDIDINVQIQSLTSSLLDISNARFNVKALDGVFSVGPFSGMINEGQVDLNVSIDTRSEPATVDVSAALNEFNLARAMVFDGTELLESTGGTWANLDFTGKGSTIADILGSATGEGGVYVENLLFKENVLAIFSSDLLDQLANALNPFADKQIMGTQLRCSSILFQLQDGVLQTPYGFATEADDFSVVGDGMINLQDETIALMFNPKPKTGLGISLNRLAGLVKLEGALKSPSLRLSEIGLLQFGASIAAAVASGGVTLIAEGLYNKHSAMSDVCAQALGN